MKKVLRILAVVVASIVVLTACDSFDCSLNNTVMCNIGFYDGHGDAVRVTDTLTATAVGTDSVLFNRGINRHDVAVPMSYYKDCDTLVLTIVGENYLMRDTLMVSKTNVENFEGLDCPVNMFHVITDAKARGTFIDSVAVVLPNVEYGGDENIKVYLHTAE